MTARWNWTDVVVWWLRYHGLVDGQRLPVMRKRKKNPAASSTMRELVFHHRPTHSRRQLTTVPYRQWSKRPKSSVPQVTGKTGRPSSVASDRLLLFFSIQVVIGYIKTVAERGCGVGGEGGWNRDGGTAILKYLRETCLGKDCNPPNKFLIETYR